MSYISAIRSPNQKEVIVWERTSEGRTERRFPAEYYFYVRPEDWYDEGTASTEEYQTYKGETCYRYTFDTAGDFQEARKQLMNRSIPLFESDIPAEIRALSKHYYQAPTPALNVTFYDIEVDFDIVNGFSSVSNPYAPINSVALYHRWKKKFVVLAVQPDDTYPLGYAPEEFIEKLDVVSPLPKQCEIEIFFCKDEKELIAYFINEIEDTDLLSGWNSDAFDMPYVGKRCLTYGRKTTDRRGETVIKSAFFRALSFQGAPEPSFRDYIGRTGQLTTTLDLSGRISADMMVLFQKYEQANRQSYKLESVSDEILVDEKGEPTLPKLEYEGSLADLYRKNFAYFIRYNLRDTEILEGFEQRLGYVQTAIEMYHMSTGVYKHVTGTIKLSELAVVNVCHHKLGGLVVNDITRPEVDKQIKGALVLLPQTGEHKHVGAIDIKSLYPSAILSMNISPEMIRGQFPANEFASECIADCTEHELMFHYETGEVETRTASQWRELFLERKWAVSGFGTVFDQNKMGIIPSILADWFEMRMQFQKMLKKAKEEGNFEKIGYYDRMQYIYKIKLNSFYGALSNLYFRFYDLRMGESTTGTGRAVLRHQCRKVNEVLNNEYNVDFPLNASVKEKDKNGDPVDPRGCLDGPVFNGMFQSDVVIYGDTDSTYFETGGDTPEEAISVANFVAKKVNESYQGFMQKQFLCQPGFDKRISCSREIVTGRGIFVDKKRYILHLLDLDGKRVDKMKIMGLDTKKTTLPKDVSKKLNGFVERYLKGESWDSVAQDIVAYKEEILNTKDIMKIGLPKGIKGIEAYAEEYNINKDCNLPGGHAASIFYNLCREQFKDTKSIQIRTGMKIKIFYLTRTFGRFKSIAIPVDIEEVPKWFFDNFEVDREAHLERLVDNPLANIFTAIGKEIPSKQSLFVDSALVW